MMARKQAVLPCFLMAFGRVNTANEKTPASLPKDQKR